MVGNRIVGSALIAAAVPLLGGCVTVAEFRKLEGEVRSMQRGEVASSGGSRERLADLATEVNTILDALKTEGVVAELHEKWFGVAPDAGSSTVTVLPMPTLN